MRHSTSTSAPERAPRRAVPAAAAICIVSCCVFAALGCKDLTGVAGNGRAKVETRTVGAFRVVRASRGIHVEVTRGPQHHVTVRGEENLLPLVTTTVEAGALVVGATDSLRPTLPLMVQVTAPEIDVVAGSSAARIIYNARQKVLRIDCSSGAKCDCGGEVETLHISASSGAQVQAGAGLTQSADVTASSGAKVSVRALARVTGSASSGAEVDVVGSPKERGLTTSSGAKVVWR